MDMNNSNINRKDNKSHIGNQSHTPLPEWRQTSLSGMPVVKSSYRKWCSLIAGWLVVIGVALGAGLNHGRCSAVTLPVKSADSSLICQAPDSICVDSVLASVKVLAEIDNSMPKSFRNTQKNQILYAEYLRPVAQILAKEERPLRVLQIGDSHVAGKVFPNTLESTLSKYLGKAYSPVDGKGVWFDYIAKNGATNQTLITNQYMTRFAQQRPDLVILSLGTNEAHSFRYSESQHRKNLTQFLEKLKSNCPNAVVLMTTPPGDYLSYSQVTYRRNSAHRKVRQIRRTRKPNPMSGKCAAFIVQIGGENQMPVWDMYSICGGEDLAQRNWVSSHYMRPDRIHFVPAGYSLQGKILGEALVNSLTQFKF